MRYSLLDLALGGCDAGQCCSQPLRSRRGGRCLLLSEITLPYQISVEMKFVCLRTVVAVNQAHTNLFSIQQPLPGRPRPWWPGRKPHAGPRFVLHCSNSVHPHVRGNSCNGAANSDFSIGLIILPPPPPPPRMTRSVLTATHMLIVAGQRC